jgi:hypothetical protein
MTIKKISKEKSKDPKIKIKISYSAQLGLHDRPSSAKL